MAVNQTAIDRLRLDEVFSEGYYRSFSECWLVRMDSVLYVVDDDIQKVTRFSDSEDEKPKSLEIINHENQQIVLLSIDNKLIKDHLGGIADCALFDDQFFRIVEFKTNAYGNSEPAIVEVFEKAMSQLTETIKFFREKLNSNAICFDESIILSCHIVLSESFPRCRAIKQEYQIRFSDENDGLELSFARRLYWVPL